MRHAPVTLVAAAKSNVMPVSLVPSAVGSRYLANITINTNSEVPE